MKRMLAQKFIDYLKSLTKNIKKGEDVVFLGFDFLKSEDGVINIYDPQQNLLAVIDYEHSTFEMVDYEFKDAFMTGNTKIINLVEDIESCGAIFEPINKETDFEVCSNLHASNLGTIARGYFKVKAGRTIAPGTAIYQTSGQALHDAISAGDANAMPYTHLFCMVKDGPIFWLTMTASSSNRVLLSANIELSAGMDCYVMAAVQSSNLGAY
jgi:hypothetical protein